MRRSKTLHKLICILSVSALCAPAVSQPLDTDAYRHSLQAGVDTGAYEEIAVGWIDGDERTTWFLGKDAKPNLDTRFEIGALSEVFTGLLFAQAAYEGKLRLGSTLHDAMPNFPFTDSYLASTTLTALATHRSGLPPIPPNLFPLDIDDPYASYSDTDVLALLANYRSPNGEDLAGYTPLDSGLLGFVVAQTAGGDVANDSARQDSRAVGDDTHRFRRRFATRRPRSRANYGALAFRRTRRHSGIAFFGGRLVGLSSDQLAPAGNHVACAAFAGSTTSGRQQA